MNNDLETAARELRFEEPFELQEWYDVGADIRINIRQQFYKFEKAYAKALKRIEELEGERDDFARMVDRYSLTECAKLEAQLTKERQISKMLEEIVLSQNKELNLKTRTDMEQVSSKDVLAEVAKLRGDSSI